MERVVFREERCKGCGLCVSACPTGALSLKAEVTHLGYHPAYLAKPEKCISCGFCGIACPDLVITVYRPESVTT